MESRPETMLIYGLRECSRWKTAGRFTGGTSLYSLNSHYFSLFVFLVFYLLFLLFYYLLLFLFFSLFLKY